jgi:hypothetical protein
MSGALVHSRARGWRVSDFYAASCERRSILEPTVGSVFRADPGFTSTEVVYGVTGTDVSG